MKRRIDSEWSGVKLVKADRFFPSSKTCSECREVKTKLLLTERVYCCEHCGKLIDRDLNAAINLAKMGKVSISSSEVSGGVLVGTDSVSGRGDPNKTGADLPLRQKVFEASTMSGG